MKDLPDGLTRLMLNVLLGHAWITPFSGRQGLIGLRVPLFGSAPLCLGSAGSPNAKLDKDQGPIFRKRPVFR